MSNNPIKDASISIEETTPIESIQKKDYVNEPISSWQHLRRLLWHIVARQLILLCVIALAIAGWIGRRRRRLLLEEGCEIMLTGRFDSDNWILAHLSPLAASKECSRIWMVSTNPIPVIPKVEAIYPPKWLIKVAGITPARLLTFLWAARRKKPHVVGGFHIMVNGIVTAIVGRLIGARSMYFCVGGPVEILGGGGLHSDAHRLFAKMETADTVVERRILRIVAGFDTVITMGKGAIEFLRSRGINTDFHVVSGGIDPKKFKPAEKPSSIDLIVAGRLALIKRIDVFVKAVKFVTDELPDVRAVILGNGELYEDLRYFVRDLGIDRNVSFVGHQNDVENWLRKSKIFVLTSDSEGLSLSMMEAMMCGLPAVVSDVGDLGDLVENGFNGFLVPRRSPEMFANRIIELLTDTRKLTSFSEAAHRSALRYTAEAASARWDNIIKRYRTT